jgi:hypothetical protein
MTRLTKATARYTSKPLQATVAHMPKAIVEGRSNVTDGRKHLRHGLNTSAFPLTIPQRRLVRLSCRRRSPQNNV